MRHDSKLNWKTMLRPFIGQSINSAHSSSRRQGNRSSICSSMGKSDHQYGGLWFCMNYYWLNEKTIKNKYPLPLPEELFDRLGGSTIFSNINLCLGYWQVPLSKEDIPKTAFKSCWGLYEFLVVPLECQMPQRSL